jgi:hypothetical protein
MVSSEEIVERSFYMNLLAVAIKAGNTLDPNNYLDSTTGMPTKETEAKYQKDKKAIKKFVYIFGIGNNQERGIKEVPRITLELQGYYPGMIGMERYQLDDDKANPRMLDTGYLSKDIVIDVHLVSKTQADMRLLHSIMYKALPTQGYIKPFLGDREKFLNEPGLWRSENIYVEVGNYYDHSDTDHGLLEHVYQYKINDGVVNEETADNFDLVPIKDISVLIGSQNQGEKDYVALQVPAPVRFNGKDTLLLDRKSKSLYGKR